MLYYSDYFKELINSNFIFWFFALAGSGMFFIQFLVNALGSATHDSFEAGDVDTGHEPDLAAADARKFRWVSIQTITGFMMMFGWTAITCQHEFDLQIYSTIGISLAVGGCAAIIIRTIFMFARRPHQWPSTKLKSMWLSKRSKVISENP